MLIQNIGDGAATIPAFKLQLTCKNAKASTPTLTKVDEPPPALPACGTPFTSGSWIKTVVNWAPGKSIPIDLCGQGAEFKGLAMK